MKTKVIFSRSVGLLLLFSCAAFSSAISRAQTQELDSAPTSFRGIINQAQKICPDLKCANSSLTIQTLDSVQVQKFPADTLQRWNRICEHIAENEWPDTILDGPYVASFHVKVSRIEAIYRNQQLLGYHLTYIDQAWNIEACVYNPQDRKTLLACQPGVLLQAAFISAQSNAEHFRDPWSVVEFIPQ